MQEQLGHEARAHRWMHRFESRIIIIYLHHGGRVCAALRRPDGDFNRAVHKRNPQRMAFKKKKREDATGADAHKNCEKRVSRFYLPSLCRSSVYSPLFEIYDVRAAVSLLPFNKTPC